VADRLASLYGRVFAAGYDFFFQRSERAGLGEQRRRLVSRASGRVLEIGAGTGLNLEHYTDAAGEIVLTEPAEPMARKLEDKLERLGRSGKVVRAAAEELPFEDSSFDTAVATFVLCTVSDPERTLAELERVLRPGGSFLFLEHVRADDPGLARWQDRLHKPWLLFGNGCNCNRPTQATLRRSPLEVEELEEGRLPKMPPLVQPYASGRAVAR